MRFLVPFFTLILTLSSASSYGLKLYTWKPENHSSTFVIPVRTGENPLAAAHRYLQQILNHPQLSETVHQLQPDSLLSNAAFLPLEKSDFKERALLIANRSNDLKSSDDRIESFVRIFRNTKTKSYIIPFASHLGLSVTEKRDLIRLLDSEFSAFVAMGGADIDIRLWSQSLHPSSKVTTVIDEFEKELIAEKIRSIQGKPQTQRNRQDRLLGICRGAQLIARVLGYDLGVHIPDDFKETPLKHGNAFVPEEDGQGVEPSHEVQILETKNSFLKKLVGHAEQIQVNSYHHQYIRWQPGGPLQLAAVSPDGVPEAFESEDGSILLMQFHPELMAVRSRHEIQMLGERIMQGVIDFLLPFRTANTCEGLLATP